MAVLANSYESCKAQAKCYHLSKSPPNSQATSMTLIPSCVSNVVLWFIWLSTNPHTRLGSDREGAVVMSSQTLARPPSRSRHLMEERARKRFSRSHCISQLLLWACWVTTPKPTDSQAASVSHFVAPWLRCVLLPWLGLASFRPQLEFGSPASPRHGLVMAGSRKVRIQA